MNSRASASMVPHSGVGGCAPMPRKPSAAASRMALEKDSVACTISGARQFGRMVTSISRRRPGAGDLGRDDIFAVLLGHHRGARQAGEMRLQHERDGDHRVDRPGPRIATSTSASSSDGKARMMSMTRMIDGVDPAAEIAGEQAER